MAAALPAAAQTAIANTETLKITQIDAVTFRREIKVGGNPGGSEAPEFCWVRLHTDQGLVGTGETYPFHQGEIGALKDYSRTLIGRDARDIDGIWRNFYHAMAMRNAGGADMRILSAINMAQLDLLGQASGLPLYRLLGGKTRNRVRVYNTTTDYWAINGTKMGRDTTNIVNFLLEHGTTAMKIYPFSAPDHYLSNQALEAGMGWIREIRERAGSKMDICVDCWGRFDFPSALRIAKALEPYNIMYLEDAMLMNNARAYARLARETSVPVCMSETLATRYEYREFLELEACDVVMYDVTWCGGVSEAKRISDMADTYMIPTSPHTCGGPLLYICSAHLCTALPNFLIMESNYWKYTHQFPYFVSNVPVPKDGFVVPPELPGIGAGIKPELFRNGDARVETVARV
jgi:L-alanine-DL-glutamate epimerase-like enolase superfamily enzyme